MAQIGRSRAPGGRVHLFFFAHSTEILPPNLESYAYFIFSEGFRDVYDLKA